MAVAVPGGVETDEPFRAKGIRHVADGYELKVVHDNRERDRGKRFLMPGRGQQDLLSHRRLRAGLREKRKRAGPVPAPLTVGVTQRGLLCKKKRGPVHSGRDVSFAGLMGLMMSFFVTLDSSTQDFEKAQSVVGSVCDDFGVQTSRSGRRSFPARGVHQYPGPE
jgi:hypothetical protein